MANLLNPFTPSEIAGTPELFYGRNGELRDIEESLKIGSVLIQGPVGIGKSSLLARTMDLMTGFNSGHTCQQLTVIADKNLETIEQAARLVLDGLGADINDRDKKLQFKLGVPTGLGEFSFEIGADLVRSHQEGGPD